MKAVVIGGCGHIGTYLVPRLVKAGYQVVSVTRGQSKPYLPSHAWDEVENVILDREEMCIRDSAYTEDHNLAMIWAEDVYNVYNTIKAAGLEDRFMFLPLPKIQEGAHKGITCSNVGDLNICIYKDTEQKELAWKFLKFLVTDPEVQQWFIETNSIPANVEAGSLLYDVMPADLSLIHI